MNIRRRVADRPADPDGGHFVLDSDGRAVALGERRLDVDEVGPKAFHLLSAARHAAIAIPRTLCVPSSVVRAAIGRRPERRARYDAWLAAMRRAARSGRSAGGVLDAAASVAADVERDVSDYFTEHPLPLEGLGFAGPLAIRSSGYEDSVANPNAGGNRSQLNVSRQDLPAALGYVAASIFDPASARQRLIAGPAGTVPDRFPGGIAELRFGILVQELIGSAGSAVEGPLVLGDEALLGALTAVGRAAAAFGRTPVEMEMAMREPGASVSLVANRPVPDTGRGILIECTVGLGQAVTGHAVATRYECMPAGRGWLVLEWRDTAAPPVTIRTPGVFVTQVRPRPSRRVERTPARAHARGEIQLRTAARVLIGGLCPPGSRLLAAFSIEDAWRRYLALLDGAAQPGPTLVAVTRANRLSHPALMFEHARAVVVVVDADRIPMLRALESRAAQLRFDHDARDGELRVWSGADGPAARFVSRMVGEPIVRTLGRAPRRADRLRGVPAPWRTAAAAAYRREGADRRVRGLIERSRPVAFRRFAQALEALARAGGDTGPALDDWMRRATARALAEPSAGPRWEGQRVLAARLLDAGLLGDVPFSTAARAFGEDDIMGGDAVRHYVGDVDPESFGKACDVRALLRGSPWIDPELLHRFDSAVGALLGGGHRRWLALLYGLAERCDPAALVEVVASIGTAAAEPNPELERALATHQEASSEIRAAIEVREIRGERLEELDARATTFAQALLQLGTSDEESTFPAALRRNVFYDGVEAFDGLGKLHLARVIDAGRAALPPYLEHLQRWWRWLSGIPAVARDPRAPRIADLLDRGIPRLLDNAIDPVPLLPITWTEVLDSPPDALTAHQLHNVLHQFALSQLPAFSDAGTLPIARRWLALANGFRRDNANLDRVTPRSISIELRALGIHSSHAELTVRGWYFHFGETSIWGAGRNARLNILDGLLRWVARQDPALSAESYLDESPLESALHFSLHIRATGASFLAHADRVFRHVVAFVDGLWELSGTPEAAVRPFLASLQEPGPGSRLTRAAVAYHERIHDAVPGAAYGTHTYRIFFSVVGEFYRSFAPLGDALDAGYPALRARMLRLVASTTAHRFARRPSVFGLILCMLYPREVAEDLRAGTFPAALGRQRVALHLLPFTVEDAEDRRPRRSARAPRRRRPPASPARRAP